MGGEFFSLILQTSVNNDPNIDVVYNENTNRYYFNPLKNIISSDKNFNHYLLSVVNQCDTIDQYIKKFICFNDDMFVHILKKDNYQFYNTLKQTYDFFIDDVTIEKRLKNLQSYFDNQMIMKEKNKLFFIPVHFPNHNSLLINIDKIFNRSRKINLVCDSKYNNYFCLLKVLKRFEIIYQMFNIDINYELECYIDYEVDNYNLMFSSLEGDLNIDVGDVYFNNANIDQHLSNYLNQQVSLNYQEIPNYVNKNIELLKSCFNYNIDTLYNNDQIKQMLLSYIRKQYVQN